MTRVIIADDSGTARMFVRKCLEIAGYSDAEFLEAKNGVEALAALGKGSVNLIVTDLTMPDMDGTELVRRVKSDKRYSPIPVLVITSAKNAAKEAELLGLGAAAVVAKPVSPAAMKQALSKIKS